MKKIDRMHRKITNFLYDHILFSVIAKIVIEVIIAAGTGILFAFGFTCFTSGDPTLLTGGVSGLCQNIVFITTMCGSKFSPSTLQSILYFGINVPILIFAFFKISKKFALLSAVVVGCSSAFISIFDNTGVAQTLRDVTFISSSPLTRALFAGLCAGVSSSIAFKIDASSGGVDVLTYYMGLKKSSLIGKYGVIVNSFVVLFYFILLLISRPNDWGNNLVLVLFSVLYLFIVSLVIDLINIRNKKVQLSITTNKEHMASTLTSVFPHGATITHAQGAYSGREEETIIMIVSSTEVNKAVSVAKKVDPNAFIIATPVNQVYGNFFIKPVE